MAATPSIKVTKSMAYRGGTKQFSNRYHFNGGTPSDGAHWSTLATAVIADEKRCWTSAVTIVGWTGYAAGSDVPVASGTVSVAGTLTLPTGAQYAPGDCCYLGKMTTAARSTKNHPIYLYNYIHGVLHNTSDANDVVDNTQRVQIKDYLEDWISPGFSDGTNTYVRAGPRGANALSVVSPSPAYIHHRDFPR